MLPPILDGTHFKYTHVLYFICFVLHFQLDKSLLALVNVYFTFISTSGHGTIVGLK